MTAETSFHPMPFGAEIAAGGAVRFRLWAPAQRRVAVVLETPGVTLPMARDDEGWFELTSDRAGPGSRYRFQLDDGFRVPDPASRCQAGDVHGPSVVWDPGRYLWQCTDWQGRPWVDTVFYELHVGAFTPEGTFDAVRRQLDRLADLGITAVELMPVADFPGARGWGYDGVLLFAPDRAYGRPDDLKRLVDEAHRRELMVFLDVVYNHFGPEGNYLHLYAPDFFSLRHATPWGPAVDFSRPPVRSFFLHNALYWLEEYRFDGLRLDAVHAISDDGEPHILDEISASVAERFSGRRLVHLVLENDRNQTRFLRGAHRYAAQWNDDVHHAWHVALTGETTGYYGDYRVAPVGRLARGLAEGFVYQGEPSPFRGGTPRGEPSADLPPTAFVDFLQNHDQIGNRAQGERLPALAAEPALAVATVALLLSPHIPLLFMGQEWNSRQPFLYFCDLADDLARAVREGRRQEFARGNDPLAPGDECPDPTGFETFGQCWLDWPARTDPAAELWLALIRRLLATRTSRIVPLLPGLCPGSGASVVLSQTAFQVWWDHVDGVRLMLVANPGPEPAACRLPPEPTAIFTWSEAGDAEPSRQVAAPYSAAWFLVPAGGPT